MNNRRLTIIVLSVMFLLLMPFIAMQFTNEVNWSLSDFIAAAVLLLSAGLVLDFVLRKVKNRNYRILMIIALFILLFLVWAELAVGIFDSPFSGT